MIPVRLRLFFFGLACSRPFVAIHTPAFSPDARTRALPRALSRAHFELTTLVIEPTQVLGFGGFAARYFINGAELFEFVYMDPSTSTLEHEKN